MQRTVRKPGKAPYDSPLRREQARGTRQAILEAAATVITESGDFVMAQVAERAGVAVRTVYHHFPDRDSMLDALAVWLANELGYPQQVMPPDLDTFADETEDMFKRFAVDDVKLQAYFSTPAGLAARRHARARRLEHLRHLAATELADPDTAERTAVMIHQIASSRTWRGLIEESHLEGNDAAEAIGWMIRTLIMSVKGGGARAPRRHRERP